jgi:hypothetical protein
MNFFDHMKERNSKEYVLTEHEEEKEQIGTEFLEANTGSFDEKDYRCDGSAIDHHPAVSGSHLAAEGEYLITSQIRRQKRAAECTPYSNDGITCLILERNQICQDEKCYNQIGFRSLIVRRNGFSDMFVQKGLEVTGSRERNLYFNDCECDRSAIDHHPAVGGSRLVYRKSVPLNAPQVQMKE